MKCVLVSVFAFAVVWIFVCLILVPHEHEPTALMVLLAVILAIYIRLGSVREHFS